jgi:2-polyprenyl-6-methoxyphenol hydroxylase-like FAD-dependent oxidoreductase
VDTGRAGRPASRSTPRSADADASKPPPRRWEAATVVRPGRSAHRDAVRVVVAGAGVAGTSSALLLSRAGHEVVLVDPARAPALTGADEVFAGWERPEVGQFRQPHNFLGRGRAALRDRLPDVYARLRGIGAGEVDMTAFLGDAPREPGDEDLATIACRRPVFDAALRHAADEQPGLAQRQADVAALLLDRGHVTGVTLSDRTAVTADLVVDTAGRGPHAARWLKDAGLAPWEEQANECGVLYYSRHYVVREGEEMPPYGSLLGGPRGDLGYLAYAAFLGDNRTFCVCVMPSTTDRAWRALRETVAFEAVARELPGVAPWLAVARPLTGVLPMGALRNTLREASRTPGLVALGDARCHTNPTFAFGATISLWHAGVLADAAARAGDVADLAERVEEQVGPDARERYTAVSAEDEERRRLWSGEPIDVTDRDDAPAMFLRAVVYRSAVGDPVLVRAVARRVNALDPLELLGTRTTLLDRAQQRYDEIKAGFPAVPPRERLLAALG